jgi:molybdopterin converting factor small subunit
MRVTVVCFGAMREHLPAPTTGNSAELEAPSGATVGDVIDLLGAPRRLAFSVLVDGVQADLSREVSEGAEVTLMPPFSGG